MILRNYVRDLFRAADVAASEEHSLPPSPCPKQMLIRLVKHVFCDFVRNHGHVRLQVGIVHLIHWLREATRARFVMDDYVAAKAVIQKDEGMLASSKFVGGLEIRPDLRARTKHSSAMR